MSYRTLVKSNVRKAFRLIGDLAIDVYFLKTKPVGYDFSLSLADTSNTNTLGPYKAVDLSTSRDPSENATNKRDILMIADDLVAVTEYDAVRIDGKVWKVVAFRNDGYTVVLELTYE